MNMSRHACAKGRWCILTCKAKCHMMTSLWHHRITKLYFQLPGFLADWHMQVPIFEPNSPKLGSLQILDVRAYHKML